MIIIWNRTWKQYSQIDKSFFQNGGLKEIDASKLALFNNNHDENNEMKFVQSFSTFGKPAAPTQTVCQKSKNIKAVQVINWPDGYRVKKKPD